MINVKTMQKGKLYRVVNSQNMWDYERRRPVAIPTDDVVMFLEWKEEEVLGHRQHAIFVHFIIGDTAVWLCISRRYMPTRNDLPLDMLESDYVISWLDPAKPSPVSL